MASALYMFLLLLGSHYRRPFPTIFRREHAVPHRPSPQTTAMALMDKVNARGRSRRIRQLIMQLSQQQSHQNRQCNFQELSASNNSLLKRPNLKLFLQATLPNGSPPMKLTFPHPLGAPLLQLGGEKEF